jgi:uncharacterized protein (DUF433 family)
VSEGIEIRRTPSLCNDQPYLAEGAGVVRVVDIVDRVRAGDSALDVAEDFGVRLESVRLLVEVAEALTPREPIRKLWEAATEHWYETDDEDEPTPLGELLYDSSVALPGIPIKGKELYRIGVELGFVDASEEGSG